VDGVIQCSASVPKSIERMSSAGRAKQRITIRGQWVVLDGDRLVGHTADPEAVKGIYDQARAEGVCSPFVKLIPMDDEPIWMGWL